MKSIAFCLALVLSSGFILEPVAASAGNTSQWIQNGISAANTLRKISKARQGNQGANTTAAKPQSSPKFLRRR